MDRFEVCWTITVLVELLLAGLGSATALVTVAVLDRSPGAAPGERVTTNWKSVTPPGASAPPVQVTGCPAGAVQPAGLETKRRPAGRLSVTVIDGALEGPRLEACKV